MAQPAREPTASQDFAPYRTPHGLVDSLYFSVVTTTTVGFGDLTPDTDGAKVFTVVYIVSGISIIGTFLDARVKKHAYERANRRPDEPGP